MNVSHELVKLIAVVGIFLGPTAIILGVVGFVFWYKARVKELQYHQDLRVQEMEHQKKMMEIQVDLEKAKALQSPGQTA